MEIIIGFFFIIIILIAAKLIGDVIEDHVKKQAKAKRHNEWMKAKHNYDNAMELGMMDTADEQLAIMKEIEEYEKSY